MFRGVWAQRWQRAPQHWRQFATSFPKVIGLTEQEEQKIRARKETYVPTPDLSPSSRVGTTMIIAAVSAMSKLFFYTANTLRFYNEHNLYNAIENRPPDQGLLTISNHNSVADDPFLLSALLPPRILLDAHKMRWGLCSLDICFQKDFISRTLRLGKALPIERRGGLQQRFLSAAGDKLAAGDWVHIYPEGRVRQRGIGYFKRGVGKLIALSYERNGVSPIVLPMYHEGSEQIYPHHPETHKLVSPLPQRGKKLYVLAGEPLDVTPVLEKFMPECAATGGTSSDSEPCLRLYEEVADFLNIAVRLLRAELRDVVKEDTNIALGHPYERS